MSKMPPLVAPVPVPPSSSSLASLSELYGASHLAAPPPGASPLMSMQQRQLLELQRYMAASRLAAMNNGSHTGPHHGPGHAHVPPSTPSIIPPSRVGNGIGNVQFLFFMTILYTRWRFLTSNSINARLHTVSKVQFLFKN